MFSGPLLIIGILLVVRQSMTTTTTETISTTTKSTMAAAPKINPCSSSPCRNGGNCSVSGGSFSCACVPGFTGSRCEIDINECESYPCDPFGKCTDLVNDYSCTCYSGYESVVNSTKNCTVKDFCVNSNCQNNGTCANQPQLARYYCICPPSNVGNEQIVGLRCENRVFTRPKVDTGRISPKSGILAGGAHLLIKGTGLALYPPLGAYFETEGLPTLYGYAIPASTKDDSIVILSPRASDSYARKEMLVIVEYTGPQNITDKTTDLIFTYKGNPKIDDINPKTILAAGGIELTVTGSNMDVVESPTMEVTTIVYNSSRFELSRRNSTQKCASAKETQMTCLMPADAVPKEFLQNQTNQRKRSLRDSYPIEHRRIKREPLATINDPTGNFICELYLAFILDALPTYENTSKSLPNIVLVLVTPNPVRVNQEGTVDFDPTKSSTITISGSSFIQAASENDYRVSVGNASCEVISLTDNLLRCLPPTEPPSGTGVQSPCDKDTFRVQVYVSTYTMHAYCLKYMNMEGPTPACNTGEQPLIIGLSVGAGVLALVIISLVVPIVVI